MGNPVSRGQQRDKPYRDALRIEATLAEQGDPSPAKKGSLRWIARRQLELAGEAPIAAKEIADRLDGKVPQAHEHGGAGGGPIQTVDLTNATSEQLAALEAIFGPLAAASGDDGSDPEGEGAPTA